MGNDNSSKSHENLDSSQSFDEQDWTVTSSNISGGSVHHQHQPQQQYDILTNSSKKPNWELPHSQTIERHIFKAIFRNENEKYLNKNFLLWRKSLSPYINLVRLHEFRIFNEYERFGIKQTIECYTERICRLAQISPNTFTKGEAFILYLHLMSGLMVLFNEFGLFNIDIALLGVGWDSGIGKVWVNENLAKNKLESKNIINLNNEDINENQEWTIVNDLSSIVRNLWREEGNDIAVEFPYNMKCAEAIEYLNRAREAHWPLRYHRVYFDRNEQQQELSRMKVIAGVGIGIENNTEIQQNIYYQNQAYQQNSIYQQQLQSQSERNGAASFESLHNAQYIHQHQYQQHGQPQWQHEPQYQLQHNSQMENFQQPQPQLRPEQFPIFQPNAQNNNHHQIHYQPTTGLNSSPHPHFSTSNHSPSESGFLHFTSNLQPYRPHEKEIGLDVILENGSRSSTDSNSRMKSYGSSELSIGMGTVMNHELRRQQAMFPPNGTATELQFQPKSHNQPLHLKGESRYHQETEPMLKNNIYSERSINQSNNHIIFPIKESYATSSGENFNQNSPNRFIINNSPIQPRSRSPPSEPVSPKKNDLRHKQEQELYNSPFRVREISKEKMREKITDQEAKHFGSVEKRQPRSRSAQNERKSPQKNTDQHNNNRSKFFPITTTKASFFKKTNEVDEGSPKKTSTLTRRYSPKLTDKFFKQRNKNSLEKFEGGAEDSPHIRSPSHARERYSYQPLLNRYVKANCPLSPPSEEPKHHREYNKVLPISERSNAEDIAINLPHSDSDKLINLNDRNGGEYLFNAELCESMLCIVDKRDSKGSNQGKNNVRELRKTKKPSEYKYYTK